MRSFLESIVVSAVRVSNAVIGAQRTRQVLHLLRIPLPYRIAQLIPYDGVVAWKMDDKILRMQSQHTPIETTIYWRGIFNGREGYELRVWYALVSWATTIYDVGANNGVYSLVASTDSAKRVHAYEPVPTVYKMLQENITLSESENITAHQKVVADSVGTMTLYVPRDGWVDTASLEESFAQAKAKKTHTVSALQCESTTLDAELTKHAQHPGECILIKVDVEGAESSVLAGLVTTAHTAKLCILIELLNDEAFSEALQLLPDTFTVYAVQPKTKEITHVDSWQTGVKNYLLMNARERDEVLARCVNAGLTVSA